MLPLSAFEQVKETHMAHKAPAVFIGHGSPMLALANTEAEKRLAPSERALNACYEDGAATSELHVMGEKLLAGGRPKAILAVSAHWYTPGTRVQTSKDPRQVYDMYGFPEELYRVKYPVAGFPELGQRVLDLDGVNAREDNTWGIDHGIWSVLVHMFPKADIPIVELSVDQNLTPAQMYDLGERLSPLRDEGIMVLGSGNVVHNLALTDWRNMKGTEAADSFSDTVRDLVLLRDDEAVINYQKLDNASYAAPTPDHFAPLLYILGASRGDQATVFNDVRNLGSMSMTSFAFGLE